MMRFVPPSPQFTSMQPKMTAPGEPITVIKGDIRQVSVSSKQPTYTTEPTTVPASTWQYDQGSPAFRRQTSNSVAPITFAERLQSTSEVSRRMTSIGAVSTAATPSEGHSLSEQSGIIYCPEKCSMDLTLGVPIPVPYPNSVPRFQAPVTVSEGLATSYTTWDTLVALAESAERANEHMRAQEEMMAQVDRATYETLDADDGAFAKDEFPIPPQAVLDENSLH
eukprot:Blabericola_migrator_1__8140@NODE_41_length_17267_cov_152_291279_g37_i0_p7_GENE_NODE_41_length_17267_cov_152_291279_g37_i0NODE_41_length_17267_cov_152_291279_g37_i0_p7_ORF_typecomplete_len223_score32_68_NODE_41_length_17267_cov_152_291279_g37_i01026410932